MVRIATSFIAFVCCMAFGPEALPQQFPDRSVRIVAGGPPGNAPDIVARIIAQSLSEYWKRPVVVENRPGAMGRIGAQVVATSTPDGYSLYIGGTAQPISAILYRGRDPEPLRSLVGVSLVAEMPLILVVPPSLGSRDIADLVTKLRLQNPPPHYSSPGSGSLQHLVTELFKKYTGLQLSHVPYDGGGNAVRSVLAGETILFFSGVPPALPHVKSGKLRAVAVTGDSRFPLTPDVPTMTEAGMPGFGATNRLGLMTVKGTAPAILAALNGAIIASLRQPDVAKRMMDIGALPKWSTPQAYDRIVEDEEKLWAPLVQELDLKID